MMHTKPALLLLAPLPDFLLAPLQAAYVCHDFFHASDQEALLNTVGSDIRAIAQAGGSIAPIELLERLPNLEIISVFGVGYDGVPIPYCQQRGVKVGNTPDVLTDDVADIAVALVLMTSRRLVDANRFLHSGDWLKGQFPLAHALKGKVAGILGLGRIGKAIAERLSAHGLKIAYFGRQPQDVAYQYHATLIELAAASDFLVVACPGGAATKHLVGADVLKALGSDGTLINIARGSVVDEEALIHALQANVIRSAGLDVLEHEPKIPAELSAMPQVVLLPHVGSGTHETRRAMAQLCIGNLEAHFAGRPLLTPVC